MLAVLVALKSWRHYLLGRLFDLLSDNTAVAHILKQSRLSPCQARWMMLLFEYDFNLYHLPGNKNILADALSRRPDHFPPPSQTNHDIQFLCSHSLYDTTNHHNVAIIRSSGLSHSPDFISRIQQDAEEDPEYINIVMAASEGQMPYFTVHNGLVWYTPGNDIQPRLYVPNGDVRQTLLTEAHAPQTSGHLGVHKTYDTLLRNYYWPHMHNTVCDFVSTCATCQRSKTSYRKPLGNLSPLPLPDHCWEKNTHDLITGLPLTPRGHDAIINFVDRLSKRITLVPCKSSITAEHYVALFFATVFRHFGMPKQLVSDRDPRFTSHFWTGLFKHLGTSLNMSIAHHPQTDGQTERANRTAEDMLRAYVSPLHNNWDEFLTPAEFAYNNSIQASTGFTPSSLTDKRHPHTPPSLALDQLSPHQTKNLPAYDFINRFQKHLARAKHLLSLAQQRQQRHANQKPTDTAFNTREYVERKEKKDYVGRGNSPYIN
eukprot:1137302-Pelagomonas_calceolata.AAC.1